MVPPLGKQRRQRKSAKRHDQNDDLRLEQAIFDRNRDVAEMAKP